MQRVMVLGAGKIGTLLTCLLADASGDSSYEVHWGDLNFTSLEASRVVYHFDRVRTVAMDLQSVEALTHYLKEHSITAVISALPFYANEAVAEAVHTVGVHYFDLTEDLKVTDCIRNLSKTSSHLWVPQCGLAPGFVGIAAHHMIRSLDVCQQAYVRVGALPQSGHQSLQYALTWSTDGLINEYGNWCDGIEQGERVLLKPLDGTELIQIEGVTYEAFYTSGGLGQLVRYYEGKIQTLNYKTLRYPGRGDRMRFLMQELGLNQDRPMLKTILERAIPKTYQDKVIVYIAVCGMRAGEWIQETYIKELYPVYLHGMHWSAIQMSTASGALAVMDTVLQHPQRYHGLLGSEHFDLEEIVANRFGQYYGCEGAF